MDIIGKRVKVIIDRPLGSVHPKHPNILYPINYGYVKEYIGGDGEYQDAYVLGVEEPVSSFEGVVIAIIHRTNDTEDKWVVAPEGMFFTISEIKDKVLFQEQYFDFQILD